MTDAYVWTTAGRLGKGRFLAEILDLPLMVDAPIGDCELVHVVGMPDSPGYPRSLGFTDRAAHRVVHWTAMDTRFLFEPERVTGMTHVCETPEAADELRHRGLEPVVVPWPIRPNVPVTPLPDVPQVTAYGGTNPFDFCLQVVEALEQAMPDVRFQAYREGQLDEDDLVRVVSETSVHVRLAPHDTDVYSSRVFMEAGRRTLMSHPLEYATVVSEEDLPALIKAVRTLIQETEPDTEAADHWREVNSEDWFKSRIEEVL